MKDNFENYCRYWFQWYASVEIASLHLERSNFQDRSFLMLHFSYSIWLLFVGKPGWRTGACSGKCMRNSGRQASYLADWWWITTAGKWVQYSNIIMLKMRSKQTLKRKLSTWDFDLYI